MRATRKAAFWLAVACIVEPADSAGDDSPTAARVEFSAPAGCPTKSDFIRQIEARKVRVREPNDLEASRTLRASVETGADGATGRLVVVEADGSTFERDIHAADCRAATSTLALIATLVLQHRPALDAVPSPTTETPSGSPPPTTGPAPAPSLSAAAPPPPSPPTTPSSPTALPSATKPVGPPSAVAPVEGRTAWSFNTRVTAFSTVGMAPQPSVGIGVLVGVAFDGPILSPSLHVGVADTFDTTYAGANGDATLGFLAGILEACPLAVRPSGRMVLRPCAAGEYGLLRAAGSNTDNPRSVVRPWLAAGPEARLSWNVAGPFSIEVALGALLAIDRDRFLIGSGTIFEIPPWVGRGLLGVGYSAP
jgi:hypothetical protein